MRFTNFLFSSQKDTTFFWLAPNLTLSGWFWTFLGSLQISVTTLLRRPIIRNLKQQWLSTVTNLGSHALKIDKSQETKMAKFYEEKLNQLWCWLVQRYLRIRIYRMVSDHRLNSNLRVLLLDSQCYFWYCCCVCYDH